MGLLFRVAVLGLSAFSCFAAAGPELVNVCEVMRNPEAFDRHDLLLAGRIEKRSNGRFVGEDACAAAKGSLRVAVRLDRVNGPMPPDSFSLDAAAVNKEFSGIREHSSLQEFKFGSGDWDRWGMVFGRFDKDSGAILCRGDALIFFWEP